MFSIEKPKVIQMKQKGASMLEALIWMGIALVVAGFVTAMVKGAFSGSNTLKSGNETKALIAGVRSATGGANYGTGSLNAGLIAGGLVPNTLTTSGTSTITNSWGGAVTVTGATSQFTISEASIPQDVCVKKLTTADPGIKSITVNGGTAVTVPVSLSTAATTCSTGNNTIVYTAS